MAKKRPARQEQKTPTTLIGGSGKKSSPRWIILIVLAVIVIGGIGYVVYQYVYKVQQQANGDKLRDENNRKAETARVQARLAELAGTKPGPTEPGYVQVTYYTEYADLLNQSGHPDQALAKLKEAEAIPSTATSSFLFESFAKLYKQQGNSTLAKQYWQKALDAVDSDPTVSDDIKADVKQSYQDELK
ncbi:MAG TPA: hypothetical protein VH144_00095 [Candidatus Saccharimonadales bacterium]|jgi:tetratricopeptide (TPR) repeat protein|nr:hypothetical protein [Candidatus Saccharimonadales bacterium]